jgi:hypothetical protein
MQTATCTTETKCTEKYLPLIIEAPATDTTRADHESTRVCFSNSDGSDAVKHIGARRCALSDISSITKLQAEHHNYAYRVFACSVKLCLPVAEWNYSTLAYRNVDKP